MAFTTQSCNKPNKAVQCNKHIEGLWRAWFRTSSLYRVKLGPILFIHLLWQGSSTSKSRAGTFYQISRSIRLEIKCTVNVMHLNYPKPSPLTPSPWKNYFPQKVRDHCSKTHTYTQHTVFLSPYLSLLLLENFKNFWKSFCCRKVDPFQVLSNTQKWIVRGDTCADKARDFIGKGHRGGEP